MRNLCNILQVSVHELEAGTRQKDRRQGAILNDASRTGNAT